MILSHIWIKASLTIWGKLASAFSLFRNMTFVPCDLYDALYERLEFFPAPAPRPELKALAGWLPSFCQWCHRSCSHPHVKLWNSFSSDWPPTFSSIIYWSAQLVYVPLLCKPILPVLVQILIQIFIYFMPLSCNIVVAGTSLMKSTTWTLPLIFIFSALPSAFPFMAQAGGVQKLKGHNNTHVLQWLSCCNLIRKLTLYYSTLVTWAPDFKKSDSFYS